MTTETRASIRYQQFPIGSGAYRVPNTGAGTRLIARCSALVKVRKDEWRHCFAPAAYHFKARNSVLLCRAHNMADELWFPHMPNDNDID